MKNPSLLDTPIKYVINEVDNWASTPPSISSKEFAALTIVASLAAVLCYTSKGFAQPD
jgi:hypothetical protein